MKVVVRIVVMVMVVAIIGGCQKGSDLPTTGEHFGIDLVEYQHGDVIPGRYIVSFESAAIPALKMKADMPYTDQLMVVKDVALDIQRELTGESMPIFQTYSSALQGFAGELTNEMVAKLRKDPRIRDIEPDRVVALAPPPGKGKDNDGGGGETPPSQSLPWGVEHVKDGSTNTNILGKAWIIDSGIDLDHDDLNVDVANSKTFLGGKSTPDDQHGHGTHVAGTVAAVDNNLGVVGVAPGAVVVSVRVLDRRGSGSVSGVIAGVDYVKATATQNDVANMSLGGGVSTALDNAVLSAATKCKFVLAAGNESDDAENHSPARIGDNSTAVYTIASMDQNGTWSYYSNYGSPVDYIEPGRNILSTWKGNGYNTISGTSMAAPHMAGILLLGNPRNGGSVSTTVSGTTYTETIGLAP